MIDTTNLPTARDYTVQFYLTNSDATDNWSRIVQPDSFSIDGDLYRDNTHYYADQPTLDPVPAPIPINFYLTLNGAAGSNDVFLMSIRTPDGIIAGPDGSDWLAWASMDTDSPVLNFDMPAGVSMTSAIVPETSSAILMLAGIGIILLLRSRRPKEHVRWITNRPSNFIRKYANNYPDCPPRRR